MTGKRILVIEDNAFNMELTTDLLEEAGYIVIQAVTGEQGVELAMVELPDLILMDIGLPGMDGTSATRILTRDERTRHIPVVALTAHAMKGDEEKAMAAGCAAYLIKPIDTREFAKSVGRLIEASKATGAP